MNSTSLLPSLIFCLALVAPIAPAAEPNPAAELGAVPPVAQTTVLTTDGGAPLILAPADGAGRVAAEQLRGALRQRLGVEPRLLSRMAEATPGEATVIALGNLLDNELLARLYWSRYCYEDALFPGPDGYTVHTVYDPHPWGGGRNVIVLGASRPEQLGKAVERFLGLLQGKGRATALPYVLLVEPAQKRSDAARAKMLAKPVDPSLTAFRTHAEQYLKTGDETCAQVAIKALDLMVETYRQKPDRHMPWPEETTAGPIFAAWDAFEECPLVPAERRRDYLQMLLAWSRDLTRCSYEYRVIDEQFTVTWNHTTFALLGLYYAGRYFDRHFGLADAKEWLRRSRLGFAAQARSWKPQEDADSYLVLTMGHTIEFSLADGDLRFFESGLIRRYADYVVGCGDNRLWPAGFGDSGYSSQPTMATAALPVAYWWTRDAGYRWILEQTRRGGWDNPYWPAVEPRLPERFIGLNVFPIDRQIYDDTQRRPAYNEAFDKADVPFEAAWDKISFRENWEPEGQYLLLDGLGRGKHLHFDTNSIVTFVQDGERWLLDHDYLVRNTTEHSMLSVLRDGRTTELVPSLAGLAASGDLPGMAATHTYVKGDNGVDWDRRVLWSKGNWFLVQETIAAREAGSYDLDLTWKTIDRGDQHVDDAGRFLARRGARCVTRSFHEAWPAHDSRVERRHLPVPDRSGRPSASQGPADRHLFQRGSRRTSLGTVLHPCGGCGCGRQQADEFQHVDRRRDVRPRRPERRRPPGNRPRLIHRRSDRGGSQEHDLVAFRQLRLSRPSHPLRRGEWRRSAGSPDCIRHGLCVLPGRPRCAALAAEIGLGRTRFGAGRRPDRGRDRGW